MCHDGLCHPQLSWRAPRARPRVAPGRRRRAISDAGDRRQGEGAQGLGSRRRRLRSRRARFPDAGRHRRGSRGGLPGPEKPPLHPDRRPARAARGDRPQDAAGLRIRGRRQPGGRDQRRETGRGEHLRDPPRPGRRSAAACAVLDDVSRIDRPRRRRAGRGRRRAIRDGFLASVEQLEAAATETDEGLAFRLSVQSDRSCLPPRGDRGDRPAGLRARMVGRDRRDLRASRLRGCRATLDAGGRARACRPVCRGERSG